MNKTNDGGTAFHPPMFPYETETKGHEWKKDSRGIVDIFAFHPAIYHNGPLCVKCGYGFCHHCQQLPSKECPHKQN